MTKLILVRHGETIWHADNRYSGSSDIPLTDRGRRQADRLAAWAATARLDAVCSSPLTRARETAAASARATGLKPRVDERLRELDFGQGEGRTMAEMEQLFPDAIEAFRTDPVAHHLPGGEHPANAVARTVAALNDIRAQHPTGGRVLVVMHTTVIRLALCHLLDVPLASYRRLFPFVRNCAITEIALDGTHASLLEFNSPVEPTPA